MNDEWTYMTGDKITKKEDEIIVSFGPFDGLDQIHEVDELFFKHIPEEVGRYDGHEVNMDDTDGRLFAYGKNAETLFKAMKPILCKFEFLQKAYIMLRFYNENGNHSEIEFGLNQV